ncbi:hypothetical protein Axy14_055 [Achromobacter phage vB_AxyS_19-32_Axy14]|nr:hypothetical protein Axy06_050 [Achromobacter phage vB_AxyS_19-32_Axy06]QDH84284.1 hypothetical protein Axy14_055 [Achromobacter phage vB_AxyS_19-32_Axy14]QDH84341.1 hypothetical protein Axy16_053 [Achromobacter phage vB_AxyS_19-32_Axy16]QIW86476.1 hypothetical protein AMA1_48 [Achromobacter phage AMA1]WNO48828.1 hypothetical protein [Achromobacter phage maay_LB1]WNO49021.1 hypothetical protein [Achromobacter phage emuu_LB7]WNO49086.1 hypothetical protein [Achromobacter phage ehaak_LB5]
MRQFVEVQFASSLKNYTYHADNLGLQVGDKAEVLTADGKTPVTVKRLLDHVPAFKTKPIQRKL